MDSKSWEAYNHNISSDKNLLCQRIPNTLQDWPHCQHKRKKPTSKQWPEVQSLKDHCKETRKLAVLLVWLCECTIKMSPVPVCMAVTRVKWLWHGIIITPLHQRMLSVLGPLLQKLGNNFIHFEQDYSPSSSVDHHSLNLAIKYEGGELQYQTAIADRSINPLPINIYEVWDAWQGE